MELAVFLVAGTICLLGALGVVLSKNPVHSALSLVATLFGIAVLFIAQDAEFLAAVQVIVYAGAIVVMFLFVIMLLGVDRMEDISVEPLAGQRVAGIIAGLLVLGGLVSIALFGSITGEPSANAAADPAVPNIEALARSIFTDYLWAFEITSILLVIGVVGAVALARHRNESFIDGPPADELPAGTEEAGS